MIGKRFWIFSSFFCKCTATHSHGCRLCQEASSENVLWSSSLAPIAKGNIVQTYLFNLSIHTQNYFQNHIFNHGIVQASIVFLWSIARDYSICSTSSMETLWTSPRWILYPSPSSTLTSHTEQATRSSVLPSTDLSWLWTIWNHFLLWKWRDSCWRVPPPTAGWRRAGWPSAPCSCPRPPSACHTRHSWRSLSVKFQRRKDGRALPPRSKCGNSDRWESSLFQPSQTSWSSGTSWVSSPSWRGGEPKGTS